MWAWTWTRLFVGAYGDATAPLAGRGQVLDGADALQRPQLRGHLPQQHQSRLVVEARAGEDLKYFGIEFGMIWNFDLNQDRRHSDSSKYARQDGAKAVPVVVVVRSRKGDSGGDISERQRLSLGGQRWMPLPTFDLRTTSSLISAWFALKIDPIAVPVSCPFVRVGKLLFKHLSYVTQFTLPL